MNHLDCGRVSRRMVLEAVRASLPRAHLVVRRRRHTNNPSQDRLRRSVFEGAGIRTIQLSANQHHGLTLETGIFISKISVGSQAAKERNLCVGDRIININNKSMDGLKSCQEAMSILNDDRCDIITITTLSINQSLNRSSNSDNSFAPTKEISHHHNKMVNRCSQTEDMSKQQHYEADFIDRRYLVPSTGHTSVYKVSKSGSQEKNNTGKY